MGFRTFSVFVVASIIVRKTPETSVSYLSVCERNSCVEGLAEGEGKGCSRRGVRES